MCRRPSERCGRLCDKGQPFLNIIAIFRIARRFTRKEHPRISNTPFIRNDSKITTLKSRVRVDLCRVSEYLTRLFVDERRRRNAVQISVNAIQDGRHVFRLWDAVRDRIIRLQKVQGSGRVGLCETGLTTRSRSEVMPQYSS